MSLSQFESDVLPSLTDQDCVLCLHGSSQRTGPPHLHTTVNKSVSVSSSCCAQCFVFLSRVLASPAKCGLLVVAEDGMSCNHLLDKRSEIFPYIYLF